MYHYLCGVKDLWEESQLRHFGVPRSMLRSNGGTGRTRPVYVCVCMCVYVCVPTDEDKMEGDYQIRGQESYETGIGRRR